MSELIDHWLFLLTGDVYKRFFLHFPSSLDVTMTVEKMKWKKKGRRVGECCFSSLMQILIPTGLSFPVPADTLKHWSIRKRQPSVEAAQLLPLTPLIMGRGWFLFLISPSTRNCIWTYIWSSVAATALSSWFHCQEVIFWGGMCPLKSVFRMSCGCATRGL